MTASQSYVITAAFVCSFFIVVHSGMLNFYNFIHYKRTKLSVVQFLYMIHCYIVHSECDSQVFPFYIKKNSN